MLQSFFFTFGPLFLEQLFSISSTAACITNSKPLILIYHFCLLLVYSENIDLLITLVYFYSNKTLNGELLHVAGYLFSLWYCHFYFSKGADYNLPPLECPKLLWLGCFGYGYWMATCDIFTCSFLGFTTFLMYYFVKYVNCQLTFVFQEKV